MINSFTTNRSKKTIVNNTEPDWIALEQGIPRIVQYADDT